MNICWSQTSQKWLLSQFYHDSLSSVTEEVKCPLVVLKFWRCWVERVVQGDDTTIHWTPHHLWSSSATSSPVVPRDTPLILFVPLGWFSGCNSDSDTWGLTQNCFGIDGITYSNPQICSTLSFLLFEAVLKSHLLWKSRVGVLGVWDQGRGAPAPKAATRAVTQKLSLAIIFCLSHISTPMENYWVLSSHDLLSFAASRQPVFVSGLAWSFIQWPQVILCCVWVAGSK